MFKNFLELCSKLYSTDRRDLRIEALRIYFSKNNSEEDLSFAIYFLLGAKYKRMSSLRLKKTFLKYSKMEIWLFEKCYEEVGDIGDAISLILGDQGSSLMEKPLNEVASKVMEAIESKDDSEMERVQKLWDGLNLWGAAVVNRLLLGGLKIKVSPLDIAESLEHHSGIGRYVLLDRLFNNFLPNSESIKRLLSKPSKVEGPHHIPKAENMALKDWPDNRAGWCVALKFNGIGVRITKREEVKLWSKDYVPINSLFPQLVNKLEKIPFEFAIDGEIIPRDGSILEDLIERFGSSKVDEPTAGIVIYDTLEFDGKDIRGLKWEERARASIKLANTSGLYFSQNIPYGWGELEEKMINNGRLVDGLLFKNRDHSYLDLAKNMIFKKCPLRSSLHLVLLYVDVVKNEYTFGMKKGEELIPLVRIWDVDRNINLTDWIRSNTLERFGPIRAVKRQLVFEISFSEILKSKSRKVGYTLRSPSVIGLRLEVSLSEVQTWDGLVKIYKSQFSPAEKDIKKFD